MIEEVAFIQVGALSDGFAPDSYILDTNNQLTGKTFQLTFAETAAQEIISFPTEQQIEWQGVVRDCRITSIREGIYFINFISPEDWRTSITIIINEAEDNCVLVRGTLPTEQDIRMSAFTKVEQNQPLTDVDVDIHFGSLNNTQHPLPAYTSELIGMRNMYTYNPKERYEHVYLNEQFYAWHCLDGVEKGLADVDRCHYIKVSDNLYLFIWREKIIPTLGIILIDLQGMRTDGGIMGYQDQAFSSVSLFPVGAHATILNKTHYPK
ncbi:MoaF C-terminal domain-containing protein [Providencia sp. PROV152]|uniref:MoaF N-terminal domain-containing protein n=1 Tax=Providencia stuartii TaxID=588 RepID=A0AAI9HWA8_PROST|nr:MoaF C-terminal domain-containing protein [Providencia sp. PROV152]ELR5034161.1 MoaF N-terminal domain-containing protein [Providencia stuartii]